MTYQQRLWMKVAMIISALILLVSGFAFGYFYNYQSSNFCVSNPFIYGVKEMNELNDVEFLCTCKDGKGLNFYFDKDEIGSGNYLGGAPW